MDARLNNLYKLVKKDNAVNNHSAKWAAEQLEQLEKVEAAELPTFIRILITWRHGTNGFQAKATIWGCDSQIFQSNYTKGSNYDKASTAVSEALNKSAGALRILYQAKNNLLAEEATQLNQDAQRALGYGADGLALPYYKNAVGMSSICQTFERCGYEVRDYWAPAAPRDQVFFIVKK